MQKEVLALAFLADSIVIAQEHAIEANWEIASDFGFELLAFRHGDLILLLLLRWDGNVFQVGAVVECAEQHAAIAAAGEAENVVLGLFERCCFFCGAMMGLVAVAVAAAVATAAGVVANAAGLLCAARFTRHGALHETLEPILGIGGLGILAVVAAAVGASWRKSLCERAHSFTATLCSISIIMFHFCFYTSKLCTWQCRLLAF